MLFPFIELTDNEGIMKNRDGIFTGERNDMVEQQIRSRGIIHTDTLNAMKKVARHLFVPKGSESSAYGDYPLPIGHGQTISQPYIVGLMTELLEPDRDSRILEIGTGSGYQTAILAEIAREVFTVERIAELYESGKNMLLKKGYKNILFRHGNGYEGWKEYAPYDGIVVTAAPEAVPGSLKEQLKDGGRLVIPVGGPFEQVLLRIVKNGDSYSEEVITGVRFVKLVDQL